MTSRQEECVRPSWSDDHLDSSSPPEIKASYFDEKLGAWVLSRYADVLAAFRSPVLVPTGAKGGSKKAAPNETIRLKMRAETKAALSLRQLYKWQKILTSEADALTQRLPLGVPVNLVEKVARPLCLTLAVAVTKADPKDASHLQSLARHVSAAAAEPYDTKIGASAEAANAELRGCFHAGAEALRDSGFVALSHTLPCLLANAWFALLAHPQQWRRLHQRPALTAKAMEELLRYAGLTRLLFRRAIEDVDLNGVPLRKGDRVILRIAVANKDPERFPRPNEMDWVHQGKGHLALGSGPHTCVGGSLIRMAAITITRPLLERFGWVEITGTVEWHGGPVFRSPATLPVCLYETIPVI
ncbi:cytochrome P450 [Alloacidobacterium dinghuense]|uniref:Cytochrome P450 n=1 Tax=Alloacidobacterium dinghuense TaxID=2763107 RepID=A0A7G8BI63_9BACT|nr:cytochrome P450 [Alloacidobacterium dinghuense]QNI32233.1 cytochrome P450 [Alloacidobacterium dinghuense]